MGVGGEVVLRNTTGGSKVIDCRIAKRIMSGEGGSFGHDAPVFTGTLHECLVQTGRDGYEILPAIGNRVLYVWLDDFEHWDSYSLALEYLVALAENQQASIAELVSYTGLSERTLRRILHGERVGAKTIKRLEDALSEDAAEWRTLFEAR